ncbi:hypothetical protein JI739_21685 [Ramlibacter sp. AW1]|uniref:Uncharacterized protein n=1 Tax=Ramlibacter aurantiacus TaxID=2801330 RepID=A0A937D8E0_9BURK|nr:hypothetical protein [Ramlibacter aurantiacus]MBL0422963.1 hypothetical protein [Ramlibacter aurantiacus]
MTIAASSLPPVAGGHAECHAAPARATPRQAWAPASFRNAAPDDAPANADKAHALEAAARAQAQGAGLATTPSSRPETIKLLKDWAAKQADAEKAGVNLRKSTFLAKLLPTALSLLTVAAAAALTVFTAGAATPFLVIASVRSAVLIGDCACAWIDRQRARQDIPAAPLPMGPTSSATWFIACARRRAAAT